MSRNVLTVETSGPRAASVALPLLPVDGMKAPAAPPEQDTPACAEGDALSIDLIRRRLATRTIGFQTHLFGGVASTNDQALRLVEAGACEGTVVLAEAQREGRRRFGRPWFSPDHANLYASVIFRPAIAPAAVPIFALIGSLALADALVQAGVPAEVRWPNEVVVGDRKIGGVLTSVAAAGDVVQHVVVGAGVNLNVSRAALECGLGVDAAFATSAREAAGRTIDRNQFAADFLNQLERWYEIYNSRGASAILVAWNQRDAVRGRVVEIREATGTHRGHVLGVDGGGRLVLEQRPGEQRVITTGEIAAVDGERTR